MIRKLVYIFIIASLTGKSFSCLGETTMDGVTNINSVNTLKILLAPSQSNHTSMVEFGELVQKIKEKRVKFSTEQQYLQFIYKYVHRKSLKSFKSYVTVEETLSKSGYYNCLTGTLLYGLILNELEFDITIREFNYHVLLIVNLDDKKILIESTDPLNGFVVGGEAVNKRIEAYKFDDSRKKRSSVYGFTHVIDNEISLDQLVGLHFYNQAVNSLNELNINAAKEEIKKACQLYPSKRVLEIHKLISGSEIKSLIASVN